MYTAWFISLTLTLINIKENLFANEEKKLIKRREISVPNWMRICAVQVFGIDEWMEMRFRFFSEIYNYYRLQVLGVSQIPTGICHSIFYLSSNFFFRYFINSAFKIFRTDSTFLSLTNMFHLHSVIIIYVSIIKFKWSVGSE